MTDEEIRIAMTEVAGWFQKEVIESSFQNPLNNVSRGLSWHNPRGVKSRRPDWTEDLNAVAQVEARQDGSRYVETLYEIVIGRQPLEHRDVQKVATATARQRCIALLKVHGKWRD